MVVEEVVRRVGDRRVRRGEGRGRVGKKTFWTRMKMVKRPIRRRRDREA